MWPSGPVQLHLTELKESGRHNWNSNRQLVPNQFWALSHWATDHDTLQASRVASCSRSHNPQPEQLKDQRSIAFQGKRNPAASGQTPLPSIARSPLAEAKNNLTTPGWRIISLPAVWKSAKPNTADSSDAAFSPLPLLAGTVETTPSPNDKVEHVWMTCAPEQGGALRNMPDHPLFTSTSWQTWPKSNLSPHLGGESCCRPRNSPKESRPHYSKTISWLLLASRSLAGTEDRFSKNHPRNAPPTHNQLRRAECESSTARDGDFLAELLNQRSWRRFPTVKPTERPLMVSTPRGQQHLQPPTLCSSSLCCSCHTEVWLLQCRNSQQSACRKQVLCP